MSKDMHGPYGTVNCVGGYIHLARGKWLLNFNSYTNI